MATREIFSDDCEESIDNLSRIIKQRPLDAEFFSNRGECLLQLCDVQSAILNYRRACSLDVSNVTYKNKLLFLYVVYGEILFSQKQFLQAMPLFKNAAKMRPDVAIYRYRTLACLTALGQYKECIELINKQLNLFHITSGSEASEYNDHSTETSTCETFTIACDTVAMLPGNQDDSGNEHTVADLYILRARLFKILGNMRQAYESVKSALEHDVEHKEGTLFLKLLVERSAELKDQSVRLTLLGRHGDALRRLTLAIENNPSDPDLLVSRGAVYRRKGDYNSAIDDYLTALDRTSHDTHHSSYVAAQHQLLITYNDFALQCCSKGLYDEAISLLNRAIQDMKNENELYVNRGDCFYHRGDAVFALADYMQAFEMNSRDINISRRIARIHYDAALGLFNEKRYREAERDLTKAIEFNPWSSDCYTLRCKARQLAATTDSACDDAVTALQINRDSKEVEQMIPKLFPGQTIEEVLSSDRALQIMANLFSKRDATCDDTCPTKTPSMVHTDDRGGWAEIDGTVQSLFNSQSEEVRKQKMPVKLLPKRVSRTSHSPNGESLNDSGEKTIIHQLVRKKKEIGQLIQEAFENTRDLKSADKSRITTQTSKHFYTSDADMKVYKTEKKGTGWRQFTLTQ